MTITHFIQSVVLSVTLAVVWYAVLRAVARMLREWHLERQIRRQWAHAWDCLEQRDEDALEQVAHRLVDLAGVARDLDLPRQEEDCLGKAMGIRWELETLEEERRAL